MTSNTLKRIASGVLLIALAGGCIAAGGEYLWGLLVLFGVGIFDEIYCNVFKASRKSWKYFFIQFFNIAFYVHYFFIEKSAIFYYLTLGGGVLVNSALLLNLCFSGNAESRCVRAFKKYPQVACPIVLLPMSAIMEIVRHEDWRITLGLLLFSTYGMDTGGWAFGKLFGKIKLAPRVSPNKTLEGFLGGLLSAGFFAGAFWWGVHGSLTLLPILIFLLCGGWAQVGDLVQSKLKRQHNVKDSSGLIPGHGGIYDRLDGLLFLAPFFTIVVRVF